MVIDEQAPGPQRSGLRPANFPDWKLEDAKARFSEVVRLARSEGAKRSASGTRMLLW
jgi:hypothetical protein